MHVSPCLLLQAAPSLVLRLAFLFFAAVRQLYRLSCPGPEVSIDQAINMRFDITHVMVNIIGFLLIVGLSLACTGW